MNITKLLKRSVATLAAVSILLVPVFSNTASAMIQYNPNGTSTSTTPVFNQFFGVPNGVGNEADFVRIKPQAGGNATYVDTLNAACNTNDAYTVRTYVHNGADPSHNGNGNGSAVAHNVNVAMQAPIGSTDDNFTFSSTVSASNAASVSDNAHLNCGQNVKLTLVAGSVKTYSSNLGTNSAPDSAVNGNLSISSHTAGTGDVWACWPERVIVTYDVKVEKVETPDSNGVCKMADLDVFANRRVRVSVTGTVNNAQIVGYEIDFGDGTVVNQQTSEHTYAKNGTYHIVTRVKVKFADGHTEWKTADACKKQVTFKPGVPPEVPTELPDTGVGNVFGIFSAVTVAGALLHRRFLA